MICIIVYLDHNIRFYLLYQMNIRDLQYLVAVSETRHFGQAAAQCFISQPTLSGQIQKLENELGVILFERTNRSVNVTPVGKEITATPARWSSRSRRSVAWHRARRTR